MKRRVRTTRSVSKGRSADLQLPQFKRVVKRTFTVRATGDTDADLVATDAAVGYIDLNQGDPGSVTKALITAVHFCVRTAPGGTLAAAVIGASTATAGGGTVLVTPAAVTGLSAVDTIKAMTVIANIVVTTGKVYFYQTTDSANAGTIDAIVEYIDLTDLD